MIRRSFSVLLFLFSALTAAASSGDLVIVGGFRQSQVGFGTVGGVAGVWDGNGKLKTPSITGTNGAFDSRLHFFTVDGFLTERDENYAIVRNTRLAEPGVAVAGDGSGGAYVLGRSGTMYFYDSAGTLQRQFPLPGVIFTNSAMVHLDLADGCTLAYAVSNQVMAGGGSIDRFDVCTMLPLPPLGDGAPYGAFRLLRDGFVAARDSALLFYDGASHLVLSRPLILTTNRFTALAFAAEPGYVWVGTIETAEKRRLADGVLVAVVALPPVNDLSVSGELRPSISEFAGRRRGARH